ncbi:MAG: hypothetical protein RCG15_08860 [Candidatus Rickettsia vulgarisii]
MTKIDERRYLDKDNTILRTPNNLYDTALNIIDGIANKVIVDEVSNAYKLACSDLCESLTFGKGEAAAGLAYLYRNGFGVAKNEYKDKLFTSIGNKLGDETCKELALKRDLSKVEIEANNWVKTIKEITKKYPSKDDEITFPMSIEVKGKIELILTENTKDIFQESKIIYESQNHTTSKTANNLYEDFKEKQKLFKDEIKKGNLTSETIQSLQKLCPDAMLSFIHGKVEAAQLLLPIYAAFITKQQDKDIEYNYLLLSATCIELDSKARKHRDYSEILKKNEKYKSDIEKKAKKLALHIRQQKENTNEEINDKMEIEANNIFNDYFHKDPIMKHFSSDVTQKDFNQISDTHHCVPMEQEHSNYPNDYSNNLNKVDITGEGSSSCFKCILM